MKTIRSLLAVVALFSAPLTAQTLDDELIGAIEARIEKEMEAQSLVGLSVAIGLDGELVWSKGFGLADLENEVPATEHTVYRLASISKPITAAAVMQLAEQGKLELDVSIDSYVPAWSEKPWPITTRQLLAHQGGVRHYLETDNVNNTRAYPTAMEALEYFAADPLEFEPGTEFRYSSYGYNLLGAVVEGATGVTFVEYVNEHIFPAAGTDTLQDDSQARIIRHRAQGYRKVDGEIRNSMLVDTSYKVPSGGFCGTAADLVRFAHAMQAGEIVQLETRDRMWTRQKTVTGTETEYGLGWFIDQDRAGRKIVRHGGAQTRVRSSLVFFVDDGVAVSVLCNSEWSNPPRIAVPIVQLLVRERR